MWKSIKSRFTKVKVTIYFKSGNSATFVSNDFEMSIKGNNFHSYNFTGLRHNNRPLYISIENVECVSTKVKFRFFK